MPKFFVVSDIHSFYEPMMLALSENGFEQDNKDHIVIVCGDAFDRGPDTIRVYDFLKTLAHQKRLIYVRGNHEDLLFDCVEDIMKGEFEPHHFTNCTYDTVANLVGEAEFSFTHLPEDTSLLEEVLDFINVHSVDYAVIDDMVFVHGWFPGEGEDWSCGDWKDARWLNGMDLAHKGKIIPFMTVVCGHIHTKWGHIRFHESLSDEIYEDKGIICIDGRTPLTGKILCYTFERTEEELENSLLKF